MLNIAAKGIIDEAIKIRTTILLRLRMVKLEAFIILKNVIGIITKNKKFKYFKPRLYTVLETLYAV